MGPKPGIAVKETEFLDVDEDKTAPSRTAKIDTQFPRDDWGRQTKVGTWASVYAGFMIMWCPVWVIVNYIILEGFNGSVLAFITAVWQSSRPANLLLESLPQPSSSGFAMYFTWVTLQAMIYYFLPGKHAQGQRTPGGYLLGYNINGVMAWIITNALVALAVVQGWLDPACIAKNWPGLFVAANVYGYLLASLCYVKGLLAPSHERDRKFSGSWTVDFWMGLELNPRLGPDFDIKLFHNCRPGIIAWALIDVSFAAWQYQLHGFISNSMLIVITLHTIYSLDCFHNEDWYVKTMDITHDHFGMMLAWGDAVFLPSFYTIQAQYLARHPVNLSPTAFTTILAVGIASYCVFRASNTEKIHVRDAPDPANVTIWGRPATYILAAYRTADGRNHQSKLLTCGWWAVARHANYTADLVLAAMMCAPVGWALLPWTYFIFQFILLNHRILRGERSCAVKYRGKWEEYCRVVQWKLLPGIY